jgi:hypothetical protein
MKRAELNPQYEADLAATDVQNKASAQMDSENRRLRAMGIDPSSGRARAINKNARIALAAAKSGAANKARREVVRDNWDRMYKAASFMQRDQSRLDSLKQAELNAKNSAAANAPGPTYLNTKGKSNIGKVIERKAAQAAGDKGALRELRQKGVGGVFAYSTGTRGQETGRRSLGYGMPGYSRRKGTKASSSRNTAAYQNWLNSTTRGYYKKGENPSAPKKKPKPTVANNESGTGFQITSDGFGVGPSSGSSFSFG